MNLINNAQVASLSLADCKISKISHQVDEFVLTHCFRAIEFEAAVDEFREYGRSYILVYAQWTVENS